MTPSLELGPHTAGLRNGARNHLAQVRRPPRCFQLVSLKGGLERYTSEAQTVSRLCRILSRLERCSLVCTRCTVGNGPPATLPRRCGEEAAENCCWLTLHVPTVHNPIIRLP